MDLQTIILSLEDYVTWVKESLDEEAKSWGTLKAREEHNEDLKKIKLACIKGKYEGSDASQTTLATKDPEYLDFITKKNNDSAEYYTADYKKTQKEKQIEVLRSLLSFNKGRISQEI